MLQNESLLEYERVVVVKVGVPACLLYGFVGPLDLLKVGRVRQEDRQEGVEAQQKQEDQPYQGGHPETHHTHQAAWDLEESCNSLKKVTLRSQNLQEHNSKTVLIICFDFQVNHRHE
ncbi:hypothetical protein AVEN_74856-1 [Araneus ventricosus]|uniref:Uncharacterized protein n=1 Tax=Araneus ventricosus TaxID=182803 RepID=A0A4Y2S7R6_ARAVE|nr:hypothetical protein AVEN_74856-1 [Araneus ventricosus]